MSNDFYLDLQRGKQAEVMVMNAFRSMNYDVMDVTKNPKFWKDDVDLLIWDHNNKQYQFEVKADWTMHRTGNIVLELTSKTGSDGWFRTTKASHIVFTDMVNRIGYIARSAELHDYVDDHEDLDHGVLGGCECLLLNINNCSHLFTKINL